MEKGQSLSKTNKGMHRLFSGRSFAVLVAPILLSMLVFNHLKKKKKSAEKESSEETSTALFSPPIPIGGGSDQYDVFLSFRGSDISKGFNDHLCHRLVNSGFVPIGVFRDDNGIPIGKEIGSQFLDTITWCKISIPIISENYASSKWCLHELIHIMQCKKSRSHIVLPIFYKVNPLDVRYLKGNFGEAFRSCEKIYDEKDFQEGKQTLEAVSYLNGWKSEEFANGHERELIKLVVETALSELRKDFQPRVLKELVGMDDGVIKMVNWIDNSSVITRMIGIYGMGGIGKTTFGRCIYNRLLNRFIHVSFLPDIRETSWQHGIPNLQSKLISDILRSNILVSKVDEGINILKSRFQKKKVLILLDDVDSKYQLDALVGKTSWFGIGSIIIVTTRNKAVLDQFGYEVNYKYRMYELDEANSLILFNRHAFRTEHPLEDFVEISHHIISTLGGHPLILEVIGSYLYKKTDRNVWISLLKKLKEQPHSDIQKIVKLSYDALEDGQKEIFLDIAAFFIGEKSKFNIYMWNDCGFYASRGIEELKLRCLIKIGEDGTLSMHDQLRDLGRNIIRQGLPPETCSRLWVDKEAFTVLMKEKGTEMIEAICIDKYYGHHQTYTNEQFKKLSRLRFLRLRNGTLSGDFNKLFSELRWLHWFGIEPNLSLWATNLHLPKLVVLQLSGNQITEHWRGWNSIMVAKQLKVLDLAFCEYLRYTLDLSSFTELEILILKGCYRLEQVHPSIGKVKCLVSLDLSGCGSLKELPRGVGELEELKELILDASGITKIPTSIGYLRKLEKLSAQACLSLREIPNSIGDLQNLQHLDISESPIEKLPSAIGRLKKLEKLCLKSCHSLEGEIPNEIGDLFLLEVLEITRAPISNLPESIQHLSSLQHLNLWGCYKLQSMPKLPSGLKYLGVSCQSPMLPQLSCLIHLEKLELSWMRST